MHFTNFSHCLLPTCPRTVLGTLLTARYSQPPSQSPCNTGIKPQTGGYRSKDKLLGQTKQLTSRWKAARHYTPAAEPFIFITLYLSPAHNSLFYNAFLFSCSSLPGLHKEVNRRLQRGRLPCTHGQVCFTSQPKPSQDSTGTATCGHPFVTPISLFHSSAELCRSLVALARLR